MESESTQYYREPYVFRTICFLTLMFTCSGPTDTPARRAVMEMVGKERDSTKRRPLGRPANPEELAEIILFLLSQKSSVVTGAAWTADGGAPV